MDGAGAASDASDPRRSESVPARRGSAWGRSLSSLVNASPRRASMDIVLGAFGLPDRRASRRSVRSLPPGGSEVNQPPGSNHSDVERRRKMSEVGNEIVTEVLSEVRSGATGSAHAPMTLQQLVLDTTRRFSVSSNRSRLSIKSQRSRQSLRSQRSRLSAGSAADVTVARGSSDDDVSVRNVRKTSTGSLESVESEGRLAPVGEKSSGSRSVESRSSSGSVVPGCDELAGYILRGLRHVILSWFQSNTNDTIFIEDGPKTRPVIHFRSPFAGFWDGLRIVLAAWAVVVTPTVFAFAGLYEVLNTSPALGALDVASDCLFFVGVVLMLFTSVGRVAVGREVVQYGGILRSRCSSSRFWCDVLSCVPLVANLLLGEVPFPTSHGLKRLQLMRLLRIRWLFVIPASHFEAAFWLRLQVVRMFSWVVICIHLSGCLWYAMVSENGTLREHLAKVGTISDGSYYTLSFRYGVHILLGKAVVTHSDGEIVVFVLVSTLGGIFFALIYGKTIMFLRRMSINVSRHHKYMSSIEHTVSNLNISAELKRRITCYHHFLALHHNVTAFKFLMQGLSQNLFVELRAHLFKKFFAGDFLKSAPASFKRNLLEVMKEVSFSPADIIIRYGDIGCEMYFILKGRVELLTASHVPFGAMGENQYFGEVALFFSTPRLATVRAVTYCLFAMIERDDFIPVLEAHPEQKRAMLDSIERYPQFAAEGSGAGSNHASEAEAYETEMSSTTDHSVHVRDTTRESEASGASAAQTSGAVAEQGAVAVPRVAEVPCGFAVAPVEGPASAASQQGGGEAGEPAPAAGSPPCGEAGQAGHRRTRREKLKTGVSIDAAGFDELPADPPPGGVGGALPGQEVAGLRAVPARHMMAASEFVAKLRGAVAASKGASGGSAAARHFAEDEVLAAARAASPMPRAAASTMPTSPLAPGSPCAFSLPQSSPCPRDPLQPLSAAADACSIVMLSKLVDRLETFHADTLRGLRETEEHVAQRVEQRVTQRVEQRIIQPLGEFTGELQKVSALLGAHQVG